jgi:nucleoside-diphosphate-sugar epimerase
VLDSLIKEDVPLVLAGVPTGLLQGKRILLTGASGVVGVQMLAALHHLLESGADFEVTATHLSEPESYLKAWANHPRFHLRQGDLCDQEFLKQLPPADIIIHAAGYGQPGRFLEKPLKTIRLNTDATMALLEKLAPQGHFLFLSTSELYVGLPPENHCREDQIGSTNTNHPRACYIEAKRCGEAIVCAARQAGLNAKSARLALAYGPGVRLGDKRVLYSFIERGLKEKAIRMMDQGAALRTYCYVADAVRMMLRILLEGKEDIYNVGGKGMLSIKEVAEKIGLYLSVPVIMPDTREFMAGAPTAVGLDLSRYEKEFGPIKYIDFDHGLHKTIDWLKQLLVK